MKLSELTNEQKTRLLAELDGYEHPMYINPKTGHLVDKSICCIPNYLASYDAIIPLVQRLPLQQYRSVVNIIWNQTYAQVFKATPSQLCDAVLVATGKAEL